MYAIAFDLDTAKLKETYDKNSWQNAYNEIKSFLKNEGFTRQQESVYFGNNKVNAVTCIIATQKMAAQFSWFSDSVKDIQMLRIEEDSDLSPALTR
ncbi:MAG: hypothetical protein RSA21_09695 [Akkermansia sp.]